MGDGQGAGRSGGFLVVVAAGGVWKGAGSERAREKGEKKVGALGRVLGKVSF
jgi:hypothetical protein